MPWGRRRSGVPEYLTRGMTRGIAVPPPGQIGRERSWGGQRGWGRGRRWRWRQKEERPNKVNAPAKANLESGAEVKQQRERPMRTREVVPAKIRGFPWSGMVSARPPRPPTFFHSLGYFCGSHAVVGLVRTLASSGTTSAAIGAGLRGFVGSGPGSRTTSSASRHLQPGVALWMAGWRIPNLVY
ncbi:hypothetical protein B0H12DRAFT_381160 [Mycena haematopus]|nr:hypothetical protein B0H12DRAFT_381160 [Mycena haematopus]